MTSLTFYRPTPIVPLIDPWCDVFYRQSGVNRAIGHSQINADNDIDAITVWLSRATSSPHTHRIYRKEIERLLLWARYLQNKRFSDLTAEDMQSYLRFIADPQPVADWCNISAKVPRKNPSWRPFCGPLSTQSQAQALRIISICFAFLVDAGYLIGNPCRLLAINKIASQTTVQTVERYLEQDVWEKFLRYIENLPKNTDRLRKSAERLRFLFYFLYHQSPRVSEVAAACMNSFFVQRGRFWWRVTGKGNKQAIIPSNSKMIAALKRYRQFLGLSDLPSAKDSSPLLRTLGGKKGLSADMVYRLVKQAVADAAHHLATEDPDGANKLRQASTHWFRHTAITHQADSGIDIRFIRASARHTSITTTQRYLHHDTFRWHEAMESRTLQKS